MKPIKYFNMDMESSSKLNLRYRRMLLEVVIVERLLMLEILSLHILLHYPSPHLNLPHQFPPLRKLLSHEINRFLQHDTLAPALTLQSRYQLRKPIEAFSDSCSSLLLGGYVVVFLLLLCEAGLVFVVFIGLGERRS